ncbi:hypothetical protein Clacol_004558 [Clathrus columnatus]|uniref:Uncharacterized protein n=1 Tax=Clathrus columnatus TaxID=1419009 RepID=A0AAV5A9T4_9AGAM|nr:hypothetical protein Clacol_004558 [Clathrus columnatus]
MESIAFSQDEMLMATLDVFQGTIHIWNIDSSQIVNTLTIPSHAQPRRPLNFKASPTLRYFAYALQDENVSLFNHSRPISLDFLTGMSGSEDFAFSADEEHMIISRESKIFRFNLITEEHQAISLQEIPKIPCEGNSGCYRMDTGPVGIGCHVWDASSGELHYSVFLGYPDNSTEGFILSYQHLFIFTPSCKRVLRLDLKEDWIRFSSNEQHSLQTLPRGSSAKLHPDGWMTTQNGELLFWIPQDYPERLHVPRLKYIIGKKPTELDLSSFSHGQSWASCKHGSNSDL